MAVLSQVTTLSQPPFDSYYPSLPFLATRMHSFYDWSEALLISRVSFAPLNSAAYRSIKAMREVYDTSCVPIFPAGSQWSCDFLK